MTRWTAPEVGVCIALVVAIIVVIVLFVLLAIKVQQPQVIPPTTGSGLCLPHVDCLWNVTRMRH